MQKFLTQLFILVRSKIHNEAKIKVMRESAFVARQSLVGNCHQLLTHTGHDAPGLCIIGTWYHIIF